MRRALNAAMAAPGVALVTLFLGVPVVAIVVMALWQWDGTRPVPGSWGPDSLRAAALSPSLWFASARTFAYAGAGTVCVLALALPMALAGTQDRFVRRVATVTLLPMALSGVASALLQESSLLWLWETLIRHAGVPASDPLGSASSAFGVIVVIDLWQSVGMCWLLLDGILQRLSMPFGDLSRMLGLRGWRLHWKLTLPLGRDAIIAVALLEFLHRLAVFDAIFVVTGGGPFFATEVISLYVLRSVWGGQTEGAVDYGAGAAAAALFLLASLFVLAIAWPRVRALIRAD